MTAGLTRAAGPALRNGLATATRSRFRAFLVGTGITALVQSSSAVTVASIGFANAGLAGFADLVWVIYGTSLGNTMTGWIVALMGARFSIGALALPLLGLGMIARMAARRSDRITGAGEAIAGFGAFFLGIGTLQGAFAELTPQILGLTEGLSGQPWQRAAFVAIGFGLTLLTQSSSATIALLLSAVAGGALGFEPAAAMVIGASVGTTSTAVFAALGATSAAKRVAASHVGFNLITGLIAWLLLPWLGALCRFLAGGNPVPALAIFHSLIMLIGALAMIPLTPWLIRLLSRRFRAAETRADLPHYIDDTLSAVPDLALRALALEIARLLGESFALAQERLRAAPVDEAAHAALARLGQEVRGRLEAVGRHQLPPEAVEAMSDGIRLLIYLDDLARELRDLAEPPPPPVAALAPTSFALLELAAKEACSLLPDAAALGHLEGQVAESRNAYEAIKTLLLTATARGELPFAVSEAALTHARGLWDLAVLGVKMNRIFLPWFGREEISGRSRPAG